MIHEPATLILIEDTPDDEQLALRALRQLGVPLMVKVARDGEAGVKLLGLDDANADGPVPDLVLCDLKLPKLSGDEILRRARASERLKDVPFVIFSSSDETSDIDRCKALGATDYVPKPVDYELYQESVREITTSHLRKGPTFCVLPEENGVQRRPK
ncbi:response regulator [Fimbriimonas ginsengisoli]|uniref:Response regulator receiver domain-containing protein n=1 Tax=Fimbriimonas ginsengisoli Gsoil 348 TaxID=661478 RepID=A0A068NNE7_FIMGI|nr:response regulator [Fimbriimonas ginsengisoli]AIE84285.1 response regulator receiver domain-containing protein [Fimbriimonas ginsengisoli Gsoil 348]